MNTISVSLDNNYQNFINTPEDKTLRSAIEEGIQSGFYEDYDLDGHLEYLEKKYCND